MSDDAPQPARKKPLGIRWRGALVGFGVIFVVTVVAVGLYAFKRQKYVHLLNSTVAEIKQAGYPLDVEEIDQYYKLPTDETDLTAEYLEALSGFPLQSERNSKYSETTSGYVQGLPYIGSWDKPLVGPNWDLRILTRHYLETYQSSLAQLRDLSQREGSCRYPVEFANHFGALLPHVERIRDASRHLSLDFELAMTEGDRERALQDLTAILKLSESIREEPILISHLMRIGIFGNCCKLATAFIAEGKANAEEIALLESLVQPVDLHRGLQRAFVGERALCYLAVKTQTVDKIEALRGSTMGFGSGSGKATLLSIRPGDAARMLQIEGEFITTVELEFPTVLAAARALEARCSAELSGKTSAWKDNVVTSLLLPVLSPAVEVTAGSIAEQRSLLVALAIERFHLKTGKRPAELGELVPDYLLSLPTDPFNGQQLSYAISDDNYLIYSVGQDLKDDGGNVADRIIDVGAEIRLRPVALEPTTEFPMRLGYLLESDESPAGEAAQGNPDRLRQSSSN